jgi:FkbM family methyltransferase
MNLIKRFFRGLVGKFLYEKLAAFRYDIQKKHAFERQKIVNIECGNFVLNAPQNHSLVQIQKNKSQPYRDQAIGITAKFISEEYPESTIVDIGANIGDTAAVIATYANNPLILVEPSDYYHEILMSNIHKIPNIKKVEKCFISGKKSIQGVLKHWGGTASFHESEEEGQKYNCKLLQDIADMDTRLIKIDTDGYDFSIIRSSIDWLASAQPCLYYENEIRDLVTLHESNELLVELHRIGYSFFFVWDGPGLHIISTTDLDHLWSLNQYLFKVWSLSIESNICNYDILCLPSSEKKLFELLCNYYRDY